MRIKGRKDNVRGILNRCGLCLMGLLISVCVFTFTAHAGEVKVSTKINSIITKLQAIPIPELPGRVIGFYERQGDARFGNGDTAKQILRCTFDMVRGVGPFQGYSQMTFEDGSTFLVKIKGVMTKPEKGKLPTGHGTGKYIKGTGRFKGIQGNITFKATMLKPYAGESKGDALVEVTGTYSLPGK